MAVPNLRERLSTGEASFGPWLSLGNTLSAELIGQAGYDWVIVDLQHGGIGFDTLLPILQVLSGQGTPSLVRVPWNDPALIMRALDLGAGGVVVPLVSTAEQARVAVSASRYPPHGARSFGPVRGYQFGDPLPEPLCFMMIETVEAMANLEAIAAVPGVDGLLLGPVDLALDMGLGAALVMPPRVVEAVDAIVATCRRHNLIAATASLGLPNARAVMEQGMQAIGVGADTLFLRRGAASDLAEIRSWSKPEGTGA